ncbi:hypothetical protein V5F49_02395 [Xanthobacter sp. V3C-3]|uniref:hypothetical protein n=1 Tax=Xanthobacter lutulentifluminis TaxID=3119935 RepID=UPI003728C412
MESSGDDQRRDNAHTGPAQAIDPVFRNGSVTAIGVVVGFSLAFLANWALSPGRWHGPAVVAFVLLGLGIGFQIRALAGMLELGSLEQLRYERLVRSFVRGIYLTAAGVLLALLADVTGLAAFWPS